MPQHLIRLQSLGGVWETLGRDRLRGVAPDADSIVATSDSWGPRSIDFALIRDPAVPWPDLGSFTPCEYLVDGVLVWSGRVKETPGQGGGSDAYSLNVSGEGWQFHLDDDAYERSYVRSRLSDWQDVRSSLLANLTNYVTVWQVANQVGGITISAAQGAIVPGAAIRAGGVYLDLGPDTTAARFTVSWTHSNNEAGVSLGWQAADDIATLTGTTTTAITALNATATGTTSVTIATPRRYVLFALQDNTGANHAALAADVWVKLTGIVVYTQTAYESGGASILKASDVVTDARSRATALLDSDVSQIAASSFSLPEFRTNGYQTPREVMQAVNAYEDRLVGVDVLRRVFFQARPTAPNVETRGTFRDQSANSGADIYNKAVLQATGPDGLPAVTVRTAGVLASVPSSAFATPSSVTLSNPDFESGIAGWVGLAVGAAGVTQFAGATDTAPTIASDGTRAQTGTKSLKLTSTGTGTKSANTLLAFWKVSGLTPGKAYAVRCWYFLDPLQVTATQPFIAASSGTLGGINDQLYTATGPALTASTWTLGPLLKFAVPSSGSVVFWVGFTGGANPWVAAALGNIDNITLYEAQPTIADQRGFLRTKVLQLRSAMTAAGLIQIGDLWLANRTRTPLKGAITVAAGDATHVLTGKPIKPSAFLMIPGECGPGQQLRLRNARDPFTGGSHRDGIISLVSYSAATDTADVQIDNSRDVFDALLSRLGVVTGAG